MGMDVFLLFIALLLGGIVGLERQWNSHPAGLRTHILVCVGSCLITVLSVQFALGVAGTARDTPGRIAANVVVGVGFLGAGAIIREGLTVRGLTTAASIWTTAGIGMTVGCGMPVLGAVVTAMIVGTLILLRPIEGMLHLKLPERDLIVSVVDADDGPSRVLGHLGKERVQVVAVRAEYAPSDPESASHEAIRVLTMRVLLPPGMDHDRLQASLLQVQGVHRIELA
jgi:putative Mg2+ transporter-C (MgtC) family protein